MLKKLLELYKFKQLIKTLVSRNLKVRYRSSFLGYAWTWLEPLMLMLVFIFVFDVVFRIKIENFPLYLITGLVPWTYFSNSIGTITTSISANSGLIKRVYYPREIFPISIMLTHGVTMLLSLMLIIPLVLAFGLPITYKILFIPLIIVFLFIFVLGLGLIFATLNVFLKDIAFMVPLILRVWFYMTPVFYSVEKRIPETVFNIYMILNPMAVGLSFFRTVFMNYSFPRTTHIVVAMVESILVFIIGYTFFKKNEDLMVKRI